MTVTSQQTSQLSGVKLQEVDFSQDENLPECHKKYTPEIDHKHPQTLQWVCNFWGFWKLDYAFVAAQLL